MMVPKGSEIDIAIFIFIILTDFVTFNNFCVLNEKSARNCQILAHNSSGSDSLNYKTSCSIELAFVSSWEAIFLFLYNKLYPDTVVCL